MSGLTRFGRGCGILLVITGVIGIVLALLGLEYIPSTTTPTRPGVIILLMTFYAILATVVGSPYLASAILLVAGLLLVLMRLAYEESQASS